MKHKGLRHQDEAGTEKFLALKLKDLEESYASVKDIRDQLHQQGETRTERWHRTCNLLAYKAAQIYGVEAALLLEMNQH
jgi:hypothetical protein